jgi:hypothetical protein
MPLTLRPTGLSADPDRKDWTVHADGYRNEIGRIYENQAAADEDVRWFWAIQVVGAHKAGIVTTGNAPTLDMAKAAFRRNWEGYETWKAMQPPRTRAT